MSVTGTIGGNAIDADARSLHRVQQLCNPTQVATLVLSSEFSYTIDPAQEAILYEQGTKIFHGYVVKATRERPSYDWTIECHDDYTKATNYFIEDVITVGHDADDQPIRGYVPQSTDTWIAYLCGLCGASYTSDGGIGTVPQGVQIGLRTVHESLQDIIAYSSQYVRVNSDGVFKFERVNRNFPNHTLTECLTVDDTHSDEWTRNVIKVFGYATEKERAFAVAQHSVAGIIPDRVTAVGAPMIQTSSEAARIAGYLLNELGSVTHVVTAKIPGDPSIHIGQCARIIYGTTDYTDAITTVSHTTDINGYITEVTIGERCPRIAGWSKISPLIYAGTTQFGVYISRDGGHGWAEFNTGLPTGRKYVKRLGANSFEEAMAIVNGSLYYTDGTNPWEIRTLPAPVNDAEDSPPPGHGGYVAVDAMGGLGEFAVLTTNPLSSGSDVQECRSWVYTCDNTGSAPSTWQSVEMFNSMIASGSYSSGSAYHVIGLDMRSTLGTPYVLASSGSVYAAYPAGAYIFKGDGTRIWNYYDFNTSTYKCEIPPYTGLLDWWVQSVVGVGDTVYITIQATTASGIFKDNLFMYGSYHGGGVQVALTDVNSYRYWEFIKGFSWLSSNVLGHPPYIWQTIIQVKTGVDEGDIPNAQPGQTIFFNLFWSPHRTINYQSITLGESCGENHIVGQSPYGDMYGPLGHGGPLDPATPFPLKSNLGAGYIQVI